MKVKDFIHELQKLDQEREIYVNYDQYTLMNPWNRLEEATQEDIDSLRDKDLNIGDYLIQAW